jgi:hypothetical protein
MVVLLGLPETVRLLQLRRRLLLLWPRLLTIRALDPFSLAAHFTCGSATRRRRDRLPKSRWRTSAKLLLFAGSHRRRRTEPYRLILTLWRILWWLTLPWTLLLTGPSRWLATLLLLLRRTF